MGVVAWLSRDFVALSRWAAGSTRWRSAPPIGGHNFASHDRVLASYENQSINSQRSTVMPGGLSAWEGWRTPVTPSRRPIRLERSRNSSALAPPAKISCSTAPDISNRGKLSSTVSLPTAVTSISPGMKPACLTACGILVGSKLFPSAGESTA